MKLCGPKTSLCGLILSVWGIIQLTSMGVFYFMNSVALLEDVQLDEKYGSVDQFYADAESGFSKNAYNCWIAACLYIFTFIFSCHQFYMNSRTQV